MASADMDIIVAVAALISRSIYRLVAFDAILRLRLLSSFCKLSKCGISALRLWTTLSLSDLYGVEQNSRARNGDDAGKANRLFVPERLVSMP
jgi:hypothetical protein